MNQLQNPAGRISEEVRKLIITSCKLLKVHGTNVAFFYDRDWHFLKYQYIRGYGPQIDVHDLVTHALETEGCMHCITAQIGSQENYHDAIQRHKAVLAAFEVVSLTLADDLIVEGNECVSIFDLVQQQQAASERDRAQTSLVEMNELYMQSTQGRWESTCLSSGKDWGVCMEGGGDLLADFSGCPNQESNMRFVLAAHEMMPLFMEAAAALERLTDAVEYAPNGVRTITAVSFAKSVMKKLGIGSGRALKDG